MKATIKKGLIKQLSDQGEGENKVGNGSGNQIRKKNCRCSSKRKKSIQSIKGLWRNKLVRGYCTNGWQGCLGAVCKGSISHRSIVTYYTNFSLSLKIKTSNVLIFKVNCRTVGATVPLKIGTKAISRNSSSLGIMSQNEWCQFFILCCM